VSRPLPIPGVDPNVVQDRDRSAPRFHPIQIEPGSEQCALMDIGEMAARKVAAEIASLRDSFHGASLQRHYIDIAVVVTSDRTAHGRRENDPFAIPEYLGPAPISL